MKRGPGLESFSRADRGQKLVGILLLVSVEARQQVLAGPDHLSRVKEGSGHVSV